MILFMQSEWLKLKSERLYYFEDNENSLIGRLYDCRAFKDLIFEVLLTVIIKRFSELCYKMGALKG